MERLYKGSRIRIFHFWRCLKTKAQTVSYKTKFYSKYMAGK